MAATQRECCYFELRGLMWREPSGLMLVCVLSLSDLRQVILRDFQIRISK